MGDTFPDELSSRSLQEYTGPGGGTLDSILLTHLTPASADEEGKQQ